MKRIEFIIEKGSDGYGAYREDKDGVIAVLGDTVAEIKANIVDAYNLAVEDTGKPLINVEQIELKYDLPSLFQYYKEINVSALGKRIGMQKSLLSEYINGKRSPSQKQISKIMEGVKGLGRELADLELIG